jgi:hypothetical protein
MMKECKASTSPLRIWKYDMLYKGSFLGCFTRNEIFYVLAKMFFTFLYQQDTILIYS